MKTKSKHLSATLAAALFFGVTVLSAVAGPTTGGYVPVRTSADAKALPQKSNVMMACSGCQTIKPLEKTGILAWFESKQQHDCPSCGGKVTFTGAPGKSATGTKFTHSCSMCGNASAYVCASH